MDNEVVIRPRVVLSRCLEMDACRYNGAGIRSAVVRELAERVEFVPVCPEVEIGLGVPRPPIQIERSRGGGAAKGSLRLVQPSTGRDLTESMAAFSRSFADATKGVDGMILKSRSPSCGMGDVKVFAGDDLETQEGWGMFAAAMRERYPGAAMEDEARLSDREVRDAWLARVFENARRRVGASGAGAPRDDADTESR